MKKPTPPPRAGAADMSADMSAGPVVNLSRLQPRRKPVTALPVTGGNAPPVPKRKNSRAKGKRGELEFAELLRANGWPNARRGQQRSGVDQADVIDGPEHVHFEVKRVESLNVWQAMAQAERDAAGIGAMPVVAMRRNGSEWLAVLPMERLLQMLCILRTLGMKPAKRFSLLD